MLKVAAQMEIGVLIFAGFVALLVLGVVLWLLGVAVAIAWSAPLLFVYIVICFFFPPALLAIPIFLYFGFKRAELEMGEAQLRAQREAQEEAERFREEMRDRLEQLEERREYEDD